VAVSTQLAAGKSLYTVDEARLRAAAPNLLVTQNLCQVCGPAGNEVSQVINAMTDAPKIVWQTPRNFEEMLDALRALGGETGTEDKAVEWSAAATARIRGISTATEALRKFVCRSWSGSIQSTAGDIGFRRCWVGPEPKTATPGPEPIRSELTGNRFSTMHLKSSWYRLADSKPATRSYKPPR